MCNTIMYENAYYKSGIKIRNFKRIRKGDKMALEDPFFLGGAENRLFSTIVGKIKKLA